MEKKSISEIPSQIVNFAPVCACGQPLSFKMGEPVVHTTDAIGGRIHRVASMDEQADGGIITQSYIARCSECGMLHLIDERFQICGYEYRIKADENEKYFGDTEYYPYGEFVVDDTYDVTVGGETISISTANIADPVTEINLFLRQFFKSYPVAKGLKLIIEHGENDVILAEPVDNSYEIFVQKTRVAFE